MAFVMKGVTNSNVELPARNGWKLFPHGVTEFIVMRRRIDGSWWMPIIRQLHVILIDPLVTILPDDVKALVARACTSIYAVHAALRLPVPKTGLVAYQAQIDTCLDQIVGTFLGPFPSLHICQSSVPYLLMCSQVSTETSVLQSACQLSSIGRGIGLLREGNWVAPPTKKVWSASWGKPIKNV